MENKKDESLYIRIDHETFERLRYMARLLEMPYSAFLRDLINDHWEDDHEETEEYEE